MQLSALDCDGHGKIREGLLVPRWLPSYGLAFVVDEEAGGFGQDIEAEDAVGGCGVVGVVGQFGYRGGDWAGMEGAQGQVGEFGLVDVDLAVKVGDLFRVAWE